MHRLVMQKKFIDVATQILRTPKSGTRSNTNYIKQQESWRYSCKCKETIWQTFLDDILDATRIENQSLKLDKQQFNIDVITAVLDGIRTNRQFKNEKIW